MKANHSSKTQKVAVYSSLFCLFLGVHPAFGAAEGVTATSDVHLARATVGESAVVRVGTVNLEGTTINGNMTITSKAQVGEISADRSAQVNVASAHFHQTKVQGNAKIELAARTANITAGQGSTVSVGGFEIDNRVTAPSTSFRVAPGGRLPMAAGIEKLPGVTLVKNPEKGIGLNTFRNGTLSITNLLHNYEPTKYLEKESDNFIGQAYQENQSMSKELQYAYLSKCSYKDKNCMLPKNWKILSNSDISKLGLVPSLFYDEKTGLNAELFYNEKIDEYVLGFEGSNELKDYFQGNTQNIAIPLTDELAIVSPQYVQAALLANHIIKNQNIEKVSFTGHSLGGGLASMASIITGENALTFNSSGINKRTIMKYIEEVNDIIELNTDNISKNWENQENLVTAYNVKGEFLTVYQKFLPIPQAIGNKVQLPTPNKIEFLKIGTMMNPYTNHGIDLVIESLKTVEEQNKTYYASTSW